MKRKLSLVLALVMILSLVPMSVFAATSNSINKVPQVKDDYEFVDKTKAPQLRIEEDNNDEFGGATTAQTFRMKLENAEWLDDSDLASNDFEGDMGHDGSTVFIRRSNNTTVEATVYGNAVTGDKLVYTFPMLVAADGEGDLKVTVDPRDSVISGGTYTFAVAAGGDTVATIDDVNSFTDDVTIEDIQIDETKIGAIGKDTTTNIKLKLPSDFKWTNSESATTDPVPDPADTKIHVEFTGGLAGSTVDTSSVEIEGRSLEFEITTSSTVPTSRGTIYIKNLQLTAEKDADFGEVELSISGDSITSTDLVVADYSDYDVEIKADGDPKELIAGEMASSYNDDAHKLQTLVIKESVENAWLTERKTRVEFPKWVKILGVEVTTDSNNIKDIKGIEGTINEGAKVELADQGDNYVEFTADKTGKAKIYLKFFVSVEAGRSGDITAIVDGRSLGEEVEVVLGTAIAPVSVEAEAANVRTGIKGQEIGKITITENQKEAIKKGTLEVVLEDGVEWKEVPEIEVVEGNLDLDIEGADVNGGVLSIPVDSDSSKPAVIEITEGKVDLDRTIAEGDIDVKIKGTAVVENAAKRVEVKDALGNTLTVSEKLDEGYFDEDAAAETVVARVITPADPNTIAGQEVKFVIDSTEYVVGDEVKTADVAPYIKDGRTMLSVRYVAQAMGVSEDSIIWNGEARTVTIFKGDRIAQITIGSNELMVNGTPIIMDTVAEIKDGRTMLPISFVAKALGATTEWDGATRTVTIK